MELSEYRRKIGKTQQECANELDISRQYVSDLERKSLKPSRLLCEKIVKWSNCHITYSELWDWT